MTIYIAPNCPPWIEKHVRETRKGELILGRSMAANTRGGSANLGVLNPLSQDEAEIARRLASARLRPPTEQKPCDVGLFSDEGTQTDMFSGRSST